MKPQEMNPQSRMPSYAWLEKNEVNLGDIPKKIKAMQTLGVPYKRGFENEAVDDYMKQAGTIVAELKASGVEVQPTKEVIALIAYLHKLGRDISPAAKK